MFSFLLGTDESVWYLGVERCKDEPTFDVNRAIMTDLYVKWIFVKAEKGTYGHVNGLMLAISATTPASIVGNV